MGISSVINTLNSNNVLLASASGETKSLDKADSRGEVRHEHSHGHKTPPTWAMLRMRHWAQPNKLSRNPRVLRQSRLSHFAPESMSLPASHAKRSASDTAQSSGDNFSALTEVELGPPFLPRVQSFLPRVVRLMSRRVAERARFVAFLKAFTTLSIRAGS